MPDATVYSLFNESYRGSRASGYKDIVNLALRESMLAGVMMNRPEMQASVKGDPESWNLFARTSGQGQRRNPRQPINIDRNALSIKATAGLRIYVVPLPEVEYEHDILDKGDESNRFQEMSEQERADQITEMLTMLDDDVLSEPAAEMETATDKSCKMHSLAALLCPEYTGTPFSDDGITPTGVPGNMTTLGTIMDVDPDDVPNNRWKPKVELYDPAQRFSEEFGAVEALGRCFDRLKFDRVTIAGETAPGSITTTAAECGIITGYNGKALLRQHAALHNENHGDDSSFEGVRFRGIRPIVVSEIDNKNLDYRTTYTDQLPRNEPVFYLPRFKDLFMIAHSMHTMRHVRKDMGATQYDVTVDILEHWGALKCRRRDTSGVVAPAA